MNPDWKFLLLALNNNAPTAKQLRAIEDSAEVYGHTLARGMAAIGHLMFAAIQSDDIHRDTLADLSLLLASLGELSANLTDTGGLAREKLVALTLES